VAPAHLSYLGTATGRQGEATAELTSALYVHEDEARGWFGRYWDPTPPVELSLGRAAMRFHDATDADVELVRVGPASGAFRVVGPLRNLHAR
jgi:hypothetical protein